MAARLLPVLSRWIVRLYPPSLRRRHGREMEQVFHDWFQQQLKHPRSLGSIRFWRILVGDLILGAVGAWKDALREGRGLRSPSAAPGGIMRDTGREIGYALRRLRREPLFSLGVVTALALTIGAAATLFALVDLVLIEPLPYPEAHNLAMVWERSPQRDIEQSPLSRANFNAWRQKSRSFEDMAAYTATHATLSSNAAPERTNVVLGSPSLLPLLGVGPLHGRSFRPEEEKPGAGRSCLLDEGLWRSRYGADPQVLGSQLMLNGRPFTIVGVVPSVILPNLPKSVGVWLPLTIDESSPVYRDNHSFKVVGRLRSGASVREASAEVGRFAREASRLHPRWNMQLGAFARSLQAEVTSHLRPALLALQGAVLFLLLIACINVASLMLARHLRQERQMALRAALGAGRFRLWRLVLIENLVLALKSAVLGLAVTAAGVHSLRLFGPDSIPRLQEVALDARVVGFTFLLAAASGLAFGVLPAFMRASSNPMRGLSRARDGGRLATGRAFKILVSSQVALALALLAGTGLLLKSFLLLSQVDPGFSHQGRLFMSLDLPSVRYRSSESVNSFYSRLVSQLESLPAVESAAAVVHLPLQGSLWEKMLSVEGRKAESTQDLLAVSYNVVTPGYMSTMGIDVLSGREFRTSDDSQAPPVALVNESFARLYFSGQEALGKTLQPGIPPHLLPPEERVFDFPRYTIVGVVEDVLHLGLEIDPAPIFYLPLEQHREGFSDLKVTVKAEARSASRLGDAMRAAVWSLDSGLLVEGPLPLEGMLASSVNGPRFNLLLVGGFGAAALLLAAAGVYGLASQNATRRRAEIGVRIALGARRKDVLAMIVGQTLRLTLVGSAAGLALVFLLAGLIESLLFGVESTDPAALMTPLAVLVGVALAAGLLPALRACRIDPVRALHHN